MTLGAAFRSHRQGNACRLLIERHVDVVNAMAVSADRRARHAAHHCLAVDALNELSRFGLMALSAGCRNIYLGNRGTGIRCRLNIVTVVTIGADRGAGVAPGDCLRVHTFPVGQKRPITNAAPPHHRLVAVASAAGLRYVGAIDCRTRVAGWQYGRQVTVSCVAIKTRCCFHAIMNSLGMKTMIVTGMWSGMEKRTGEIRKRLA